MKVSTEVACREKSALQNEPLLRNEFPSVHGYGKEYMYFLKIDISVRLCFVRLNFFYKLIRWIPSFTDIFNPNGNSISKSKSHDSPRKIHGKYGVPEKKSYQSERF